MDRGLALLLWLSDGLAHRDIGPALPGFCCADSCSHTGLVLYYCCLLL